MALLQKSEGVDSKGVSQLEDAYGEVYSLLFSEHGPASNASGVVAVPNGLGARSCDLGWLEHGLPECSEVGGDDSLGFGTEGLDHLVRGCRRVSVRATFQVEVVMLTSMQEEEGAKLKP